jgi:NAD(P)-dependent dehydrogenase (short-subunit alcohol dehydrogenase family)
MWEMLARNGRRPMAKRGAGGRVDEAEQATFKPDLLAGKTAFISGGTSGINLGIAKRFTSLGARVAVLGRNAEKAHAAAAEIDSACGAAGTLALTADVRDYAALDSALATAAAELGKLDILIAGQAGNFPALALGMSANAFKAVIDIDLIGTFNVFRAGHRHLSIPGASLIAITAGQAVRPIPLQSHVCAAKAGVNMIVKTLAIEWGPMGVRVNGISPGPIADTEGMRRLAPTPEAEQGATMANPLRRFGRKDEIGDAAVFLCSPAGAYVTGTILDVDGGSGAGSAAGLGRGGEPVNAGGGLARA